jgi:hypothetical protein
VAVYQCNTCIVVLKLSLQSRAIRFLIDYNVTCMCMHACIYEAVFLLKPPGGLHGLTLSTQFGFCSGGIPA